MADLETTQSKLRSTPTGGVSGEHSPYYRRLLSAGYKGYVQGTLGGASLYGTMGLAVGAIVGIPAFFLLAPAAAPFALLAIPAMGAVGAFQGAHSFADIGKTAAVMAEYADTNEKRRYLLDRYYETPSDKEAAAIKEILEHQQVGEKPKHMFHWRTALIGAIAGLAIVGGLFLLANAGVVVGGEPLLHLADALILKMGGSMVAGHAVVGTGLAAMGAALGAACGAMIGLDREYVRRWMDGTENVVHDPSHVEQAIISREREIAKITEASNSDLRLRPRPIGDQHPVEKLALTPQSTASLDQTPARAPINTFGVEHSVPTTTVSSADLQDRLQEYLHPARAQ